MLLLSQTKDACNFSCSKDFYIVTKIFISDKINTVRVDFLFIKES